MAQRGCGAQWGSISAFRQGARLFLALQATLSRTVGLDCGLNTSSELLLFVLGLILVLTLLLV